MTKYLSDKDIEEFFRNDEDQDAEIVVCRNCNEEFSLLAPGSKHRNHCPFCLFSVHVDENVGDRKSSCHGLMQPIGKFLRPNKEEVIIHKCLKCGKISNNRVVGDDDFDMMESLKILPKEDGG